VDDTVQNSNHFLEDLKKVFNETGYFDICGIALNGFELIELTEKHNPELIITDLKMPYISGFEATRRIKKKNGVPTFEWTKKLRV
jgi:CheY-like chemotaxis protein